MASEDNGPPATLPAGGPRTAKKRKSIKRIPFQDFYTEDDSVDRILQVADAKAQPVAFNHGPVSLASGIAQDVESDKRKDEGQNNQASEPAHAKALEDETPIPSSLADHSVQVSATNDSVPQDRDAENQGMETASSSPEQSQSCSLGETQTVADLGHKLPEGPESDSSCATPREELQQDTNEGDIGSNSPIASLPTIQVQHPTPVITPTPLAQYFPQRIPGSSGTLNILIDMSRRPSVIAAEQSMADSGQLDVSNHLEVPSEISTLQNVIGAGEVAHSTDGWRTSSGRSLKGINGQHMTEPMCQPGQNQDSMPSSSSTIEQSAYSAGDHSTPDQAIRAPASATTEGDITSQEGNANDSPTENIRPTPQNLRYGTYPTQQGPQNRNPPLGSGRLQNTTKLGAYKLELPEMLCGHLTVVEHFR